MYTSVILLALAGGGGAAPAAQAPSWQVDYPAARQQGRREGKVLAVFIDRGPTGWARVSTTGKLSPAARRLLADRYVCVYVDANQPAGRKLADAFGMKDGTGLVLSTRGGQDQAFRHEGRISPGDLERCLGKYAGRRVITRTETLQTQQTSSSYYPPATPTVAAPAAPVSVPSYGSFGGGFGGGFGGFGGGFGSGGGC